MRIPPNGSLMPYICPDFNKALLNFRLFLKLGVPLCLDPGEVAHAAGAFTSV